MTPIFPDIALWIVIVLLFVFTLNWNQETLRETLREIFLNFTPYIFVIYINFIIFKFVLLKKKYVLYGILTVLVYVIFYYLIMWIRVNFIPQRNDDIIFSIFLFSFVYIGFRYLITAPREILKFKNEETKRIKAERDLQELESKHSQAELEVLKSQFNPHFLFNSLNKTTLFLK